MPTTSQRLDDFKAAIRDVAEENAAEVFIYSGMIDDEGHSKLNQLACQFGGQRARNVLLYITTYGGDADCAFRIARLIQRKYSEGKFTIYVNTICKSAGALIAIGADEIIMSELSELGPLDVQLAKPDALAERTSGLTPKQALNTLQARAIETLRETFLDLRLGSNMQITTRTALDVATQLTTGLFSKIYEQIDPMRLGEISRAMSIAEKYGSRIARANLKADTLRRLIEDYPSHGFVIDISEAEELFEEVRQPTHKESLLAKYLTPYTDAGMSGDSATVEFLSVMAYDEPGETKHEVSDDEKADEKSDDFGAVQESGRKQGQAIAEEGAGPGETSPVRNGRDEETGDESEGLIPAHSGSTLK